MKVCPNCGYKIDFGSANFCHNCENHLMEINTSTVRQIGDEKISKLTSSNALFQHIENENNNINIEDKYEDKEDISSIYDLGINLEEVVEQILKKRGFYRSPSKYRYSKCSQTLGIHRNIQTPSLSYTSNRFQNPVESLTKIL